MAEPDVTAATDQAHEAVTDAVQAAVAEGVARAEARAEAAEQAIEQLSDAALRDKLAARIADAEEDLAECADDLEDLQNEVGTLEQTMREALERINQSLTEILTLAKASSTPPKHPADTANRSEPSTANPTAEPSALNPATAPASDAVAGPRDENAGRVRQGRSRLI